MKLYYFETPNARKPCAVAKHLNSPVEFVRIDLSKGEHQAPEYLAINPNGKVPALSDGEVRLWEGHAIMAYLADKAGSDLWPKDSAKQIDILRWLNWDTAHFSRHAGTLFFQHYIKAAFGMGEPDAAAVEEATGFFKRFASILDNHLKGRTFLVGDNLTIADFGVACMLPTAQEAQLPLGEFTQVRRWHDGLMQLPAWKDPYPALQSALA
jgi:glutathione S-transferase